MTNQEASKIIKDGIEDMSLDFADEEQYEALTIAIKALEQEPSGDAISRQAVLDGIAIIAKAKAKSGAQKSLMGRVMFFTEHLSSVTPQPKTGHWIEGDRTRWKCSNCEYGVLDWNNTPYCPNCGAKMVQESEG